MATNTNLSVLDAIEQIINDKSAAKKWNNLDVGIEYEGRSITLPADPSRMPTEKAIEALQRKLESDNQPFELHEIIDAHPHDALVAFYKAAQKLYGMAFATERDIRTMFGTRKGPPVLLTVKTGPGERDVVQVPFGTFSLPGIESVVKTDFHTNEKGEPCLVIHGTVKNKDRHLLMELAEEARRIVRNESIYRGKAISMHVDDDGDLDLGKAPEFLDVSDTFEGDLIFDAEVMEQIDVNILVPMKQTALCRKLRIPLKRGVLLEGPFGTGKTLTARMAANIASRNGWTFVLLNRVQGLRHALEFARRYAPAIVFAEDIDRVACERDEALNDLINTIDGVVSKRSEVMTVLTTNFVERLNPVILRPGRLDAVISLRPPGAKTVEKLIRHYAGKLLAPDTDLTVAGLELAGQIPASIREAVERAKLSMVGREDTKLQGADLVMAAKTMKNHLALLNPKVEDKSIGDKLVETLRHALNGHDEVLAVIKEKVADIHDHVV